MQTKRKIGAVQQKLPSRLSYQGTFFSSMAHLFICSSSHPPFNVFRDEIFLQMINYVAGEKDFKSLTIIHLKIHVNTEWNTFKKSSRQEVLDHHEKANKKQFCQFAHDVATLLNKDKYQAFGMQFTDTKFGHNNVIASSFRKPLSYKD